MRACLGGINPGLGAVDDGGSGVDFRFHGIAFAFSRDHLCSPAHCHQLDTRGHPTCPINLFSCLVGSRLCQEESTQSQ